MFGQQGLKLGRKSGSESGEGWLGFIQGQFLKKEKKERKKPCRSKEKPRPEHAIVRQTNGTHQVGKQNKAGQTVAYSGWKAGTGGKRKENPEPTLSSLLGACPKHLPHPRRGSRC